MANVCNNKCNFHPKHQLYVHTIHSLIHKLTSLHYSINIHWIPGHTDNNIHTQTDNLAKQAALSSRAMLNIVRNLQNFTDQYISGDTESSLVDNVGYDI